MRGFKSPIKTATTFAAAFCAAATLAGCEAPRVEPVIAEDLPLSSEDQEHGVQRTYEVVMVRNGCEVGQEVKVSDSSGTFRYPAVAICPPAGTEATPDSMSPGVTFNVRYNRLGCEVGDLDVPGMSNPQRIVLCPAQGEAATSYSVRINKTQTVLRTIEQRRPG